MAKNGISNHQTGFYIIDVSAHFSPRGIMLRITGIAQEIDTNFCQIYTFPYDIFQSFGK